MRCVIYQYEEIVSYMIETLHTPELRQVFPHFYFTKEVFLFPTKLFDKTASKNHVKLSQQ
jgi:hypothetical protein